MKWENIEGSEGEKLVIYDMELNLDPKTYQGIHNIIIPAKNGTTQIDHLLISPFGIFIVETKNIKGWIFGSYNKPKWAQVLYSKKYFFQNPIRQIFRQKKTLSEYLNINERFIHTIIYFASECEFKTDMPSNVINSELCAYIEKYQNRVLIPEEISFILQKLKALASDPSLTAENHLKSLQNRHNSISVCPKCGSKLVERIAIKGSEASSKFLGCENYPKCRFTKNIDQINKKDDPSTSEASFILLIVLLILLLFLFRLFYQLNKYIIFAIFILNQNDLIKFLFCAYQWHNL